MKTKLGLAVSSIRTVPLFVVLVWEMCNVCCVRDITKAKKFLPRVKIAAKACVFFALELGTLTTIGVHLV